MVQEKIPTIEEIIAKIKAYNPMSDSGRILRAYETAKVAHEGQLRDSGEEYIMHPLAVADILSDLQLDDTTIISGLLHDVVEDTKINLEQIQQEFGNEVLVLVNGVTKLNRLEYHSRQEQQAENLRKMFLAMANDIRIILIKLADRLHNMRTLKHHHSALRQKEIAEETQTIFAPLAHRLGIFKIKSELEDLSFAILEPEKYKELAQLVNTQKAERDRFINEMCEVVREEMKRVGIKADVSGRFKNFYSIHNKMNRQQKELNEIFDLYAVRVIVDTVKDCYGVLGVIHTLWKPIPGRFKDYIAMPKINMYQSLHTTVLGDQGDPFEVQIRTWEMHRTAEYGIAAHWRYKEGRSADEDFEKKVEWLRQMLDWQQELSNASEFVESVKVDLFADSVYVFSPAGDVYELPAGSVPIDFAYRVHTQIGHQCVGAKVNKRLVPLDYRLRNGDIVEVLTAKGRGPSRDWLKIVKSQQAQNKIRQWFRKERKEENSDLGKEMLEKECKRYGHEPVQILKPNKLLEACKRFNVGTTLEDLYAAVGDGALKPEAVMLRIKEDYKKEKQMQEVKIQPETEPAHSSSGIWVRGVSDVMVRMARCCKPLPGDDIVGYVTRGRGISVHQTGCPNIKHYEDTEPDRLIEVGWGKDTGGVYQAELLAIANDRERLAMDIMAIIAETKTVLNGVHVDVDKKNNLATLSLKLEVKTADQLSYLISRIQKVPNVLEVHRMITGGGKEGFEQTNQI